MTSRRSGHRRRRIAALCAVAILLCRPMATPVGLAEPAEGGFAVRVAELTPQAERAINRALKYLARTQAQDGGWGTGHRGATTAVAMMAFMLQGHFPKHGRYGKVVDRGLVWLLRKSKAGAGYFGTNMYQHARSDIT